MIRAVFFGTPAGAVPALAALVAEARVELVVTRPDRPRGRSGRPLPPAVKVAAASWGLPVAQPGDTTPVVDTLARCDVAVVVAYGRIIPEAWLDLPRAGFVNLHFSILPRWRGAAPVARAILAGDTETGVSLMRLDAGLDTGPVGDVRRVAIRPDETAGELAARLASEAAGLLRSAVDGVVDGAIAFRPQDDAHATGAPKLTVDEARLDPDAGLEPTLLAVRAYNPAPGAWTVIDGKRVKVWRGAPATVRLPPGMLGSDEEGPVIGTGDGSIRLVEVQPEGRSRMDGASWWRGRRGTARRIG